MAIVYRSVRLVILNTSNAALTVESAEVLLGAWGTANAPGRKRLSIAGQSALTLDTLSSDLHVGIDAFMRLGSTLGHVYLHWRRPWIGEFVLETEADPWCWTIGQSLVDSDPATISALVTLSAAIGGG